MMTLCIAFPFPGPFSVWVGSAKRYRVILAKHRSMERVAGMIRNFPPAVGFPIGSIMTICGHDTHNSQAPALGGRYSLPSQRRPMRQRRGWPVLGVGVKAV